MGEVPEAGTRGGTAGGSLSRAAVETGVGVAGELLHRSVSVGTWVAYSSVWGEWSVLVSSVRGCFSTQDRLALLLYFIGTEFTQGTSV